MGDLTQPNARPASLQRGRPRAVFCLAQDQRQIQEEPRLVGAGVADPVLRSGPAALVHGRAGAAIPGADGGAAGQKRVRQGRAAIVGQRAERAGRAAQAERAGGAAAHIVDQIVGAGVGAAGTLAAGVARQDAAV